MQTFYKISLKDLNKQFVAALQEQFEEAEVEITIHPAIAQKNKGSIMTENLFWEVIALLDWSQADEYQDDEVLKPAIEQLSQMQVMDIYQFQEILAEKLYALDARVYAEQIGESAFKPTQYFSVDVFLYARCCVVANGKAFYEKVIASPETMPKDLDFESLLSIASAAYQDKTGRDDFAYLTTYSYETYSNKAGWKVTTTLS